MPDKVSTTVKVAQAKGRPMLSWVGKYELSIPAGSACIGLKITDMLGEEVLVTLTLDV